MPTRGDLLFEDVKTDIGVETVVTYHGQQVGSWRADNLADEARRKIDAALEMEEYHEEYVAHVLADHKKMRDAMVRSIATEYAILAGRGVTLQQWLANEHDETKPTSHRRAAEDLRLKMEAVGLDVEQVCAVLDAGQVIEDGAS